MASFPGWHEERDDSGNDIEIKPFPSRPLVNVCLLLVVTAGVAGWVGTLWQHIAAVSAATMVERGSYQNIKAAVGTIAMVLGWLGVSILLAVAVGLLVLILSLKALDRLV